MDRSNRSELPVGLVREGKLSRDYLFSPLTGELESLIDELSYQRCRACEFIDQILLFSLEEIGGQSVSLSSIQSLSVVDREFLLLKLAEYLDPSPIWMTRECNRCGSKFDLNFDLANIPVKKSGRNVSDLQLMVGERRLKLRLPNGHDQIQVSGLDEDTGVERLIRLCIESVDGDKPADSFFDELSDDDLSSIDEFLGSASPAISTSLITQCPECESNQRVEIDICGLLRSRRSPIFHEIHTIAEFYHWSEKEILNLPKARRAIYLNMIDKSQGMYR